jgi:hypothetical protein
MKPNVTGRARDEMVEDLPSNNKIYRRRLWCSLLRFGSILPCVGLSPVSCSLLLTTELVENMQICDKVVVSLLQIACELLHMFSAEVKARPRQRVLRERLFSFLLLNNGNACNAAPCSLWVIFGCSRLNKLALFVFVQPALECCCMKGEFWVQGSVGTALVRAFGGLWVYAGVLHLLNASFLFALPLLLREFLKNIVSTHPNSQLIGVFWAFALSLCALMATLLRMQTEITLHTVRLYMQQSLRQLLYVKTLAISQQVHFHVPPFCGRKADRKKVQGEQNTCACRLKCSTVLITENISTSFSFLVAMLRIYERLYESELESRGLLLCRKKHTSAWAQSPTYG